MAYSKGAITIPNVTGNIEITVTTEQAVPQPVEVYTGDASQYLINYGAGSPAPTARAGSYVTNLIPVNFETRPCICVKGLKKGDQTTPQLYKIMFCNNGTVSFIEYSQNLPITQGADGWNIDLSQSQYYSQFKGYNGIMLHIQVRDGGASMSASDVLPTSQVSIKLSAEHIY